MKKSHRYFIPIATIILGLLSTLSPFAIDTFLLAMPAMAQDFGVEINKIQFAITFFLIGFSVGQFFGGPLSDSFGRKKIAIIGLFIYGVSAACIPFCKSIEMVWALRFFQAIGGGFASVTNMAFIRDWFEGKLFVRLASIISVIMMLAPLVSPIIGGLLIENNTWSIVFFFMASIALIIFLLIILILPESKKREELSYVLTANQLIDKYKTILSSKSTVLLVLTIAFSMAGMFIFITTSTFIYIKFFKIEPSMFYLLFATGVILNISLAVLNTVLLKYFELRSLMKIGLYMQLSAALVLIVVSFLPSPPFILVFIALVIIVGFLSLVFINGSALVIDTFPEIGGSANAVIGVLRFAISSMVCSLVSLFHNKNLIHIGIGMFLTIFVANVLFFWSKKYKNNQSSLATNYKKVS